MAQNSKMDQSLSRSIPTVRWFKPFVFLACLVPLMRLAWKGFHAQLGANPIEVITHSTGDWTLRFVLVTLSVTPLRKLSRQLWMIPLALTSTTGWIRRLGGRRWNLLHRLIYFTGIGGVIHYLWLVKADIRKPVQYGIVLAILMSYRAVAWFRSRNVGKKGV